MIQGMTSSVSWIQLQMHAPFQRRRLLEHNPWQDAQRMLFWVSILFIPLTIIHYIAYHVLLRTRFSGHLQGILIFPALELVILGILVNPFVKVAGRLIRYGGRFSIPAGIGILALHPGIFIAFAIWYIYHEIVVEKNLFFVYNAPTSSYWQRFIANIKGTWYPEQDRDKMGALFENAQPPRPDKGIPGTIRVFFVPWNIFKTSVITFVLSVASSGMVASFVKTTIILFVQLVHTGLLIRLTPVHRAQSLISDIITECLDNMIYGTTIVSLALVSTYGKSLSQKARDTIDMIMFVCQAGILAVQIIFQIFAVAVMLITTTKQKKKLSTHKSERISYY